MTGGPSGNHLFHDNTNHSEGSRLHHHGASTLDRAMQGKEAHPTNVPSAPVKHGTAEDFATNQLHATTLDASLDDHQETSRRSMGISTGFAEWSERRQQMAGVLTSKRFDMAIGVVIVANSIVLICETDQRAKCEDPSSSECTDSMLWFTVAGNGFLAVYIVELILKLGTYRLSFFRSSWNNFDFLIVALSILSEVLGGMIPAISVARVFRAVRLAKVFRVLMVYKELYLIIFGFMSAMRAIFWATLLLSFLLTIWSIFAVELLHPVNKELADRGIYAGCPRCARAFESVMAANLTFLQTTISGDSWGMYAIPIIEDSPLTVLLFLGVWSTVVLGFSNLILAVIVDCAADARQDDLAYQERVKMLGEEAAMQQFVKLCKELDQDGSNRISLNEFVDAYDNCQELAQMLKIMNIEKSDVPMLFAIMDDDQSGDIDYNEFANTVHKMRSSEAYASFTFIKHEIREVRAHTDKVINDLKAEIVQLVNAVTNAGSNPTSLPASYPEVPVKSLATIEESDTVPALPAELTNAVASGAGLEKLFQDEVKPRLDEITESLKLLASRTFQPPVDGQADPRRLQLLSLPTAYPPGSTAGPSPMREPKDSSRTWLGDYSGRVPSTPTPPPFTVGACSTCVISPKTQPIQRDGCQDSYQRA